MAVAALASVDDRALLHRGAGEPACIGQRLDAATPRIVHPGVVAPGADEVRNLVAFEKLHIASPSRPLARPFPVEATPLGAKSARDIARTQRLAFDGVALHELEDQVATPIAKLEEAFAPHRTQGREDVLGQYLHTARIHLPAVAAGASPARLAGIEHHNPPAGPGEMERGRKPRVACADHHHVGGAVRFERRALGTGRRSGRPQAVWHHGRHVRPSAPRDLPRSHLGPRVERPRRDRSSQTRFHQAVRPGMQSIRRRNLHLRSARPYPRRPRARR